MSLPPSKSASASRSRSAPADRVVVEAAREEAGRGFPVVIGTERDDEEVRVVGVCVGDHPPGERVDAGHELLSELDASLVEVAVMQPHLVGRLPADHHLELGEPEDERVAAIEQRDADEVLCGFGEPCRQLQTAEPFRRSTCPVRPVDG
jgi:hypothetical protein